jgi:gluconokinase
VVIVVMGVAGSGKTTIGRWLARELDWTFLDADDFHPRANLEKLGQGVPLDDADRMPWLENLRNLILDHLEREENVVLACSALKARYRDYLLVDERVEIAYLKGARALILERLRGRQGHFVKPEILESQFADLEEPEYGSHFDISPPPGDIVRAILARLRLPRQDPAPSEDPET